MKSIKRICEQVFHSANQSNRVRDIHPTLLRLKILILEKLENSEFDLSELSLNELKELKDEISFSLKLGGPFKQKTIHEFNKTNSN